MIRLGSVYRVEYQDEGFRSSSYIMTHSLADAEALFKESCHGDKVILVIHLSIQDVYGEKDE